MSNLSSESAEGLAPVNEDCHSASHHAQLKFDAFLSCLINDQAALHDRQPDVLALDTVDQLARLLRAGQPDQRTLDLLANFLEKLVTEADESKIARKQILSLAYQLLGYNSNGRNNNNFFVQRARAAYEMHLWSGATQETAERAAYDAYFARPENSEPNELSEPKRQIYAVDALKPKLRNGRPTTVGKSRMETIIRPLLRQAGLIKRKPAGRPKDS